jgi:NADPH:quinone reductase-like Zn-dependent oxidoreductase
MQAAVASGAAPEGDFTKVEVVSDHTVPQPGRGEVLIKVVASSVNPVDFKLLESWPYDAQKVLGFDVAGVVEKVGPGCTRLKPGDAVWADLGTGLDTEPQLGAWAEFAVATESQVGFKPKSLSFQDAATLPLVGLTNYQVLKQAGAPWKDRSNVTVVITSGSGGTGTAALQMAKAYGATRIITSSSPSHFDLLKRLGATDLIDYHEGSIWDALQDDTVDVVYDNYGAPGTADLAMPSLRSDGVFIFLPGKGGDVSKKPKPGVTQINYGLCDPSRHEDLDALTTMVDAGKLVAVATETYPLVQIAAALNSSVAGHVVGKIGIQVGKATSTVVV